MRLEKMDAIDIFVGIMFIIMAICSQSLIIMIMVAILVACSLEPVSKAE